MTALVSNSHFFPAEKLPAVSSADDEKHYRQQSVSRKEVTPPRHQLPAERESGAFKQTSGRHDPHKKDPYFIQVGIPVRKSRAGD